MQRNFRQAARKLATVSALTLGAVSIATNSYAATGTANMGVSATIAASCTISASAVAFGAYDPVVTNASDALVGTGGVSTTCTSGAAVIITLSQGVNAAGGSTAAVPLRQMASSTNRLAYLLYSESGRTTVWGDTSATGKADTGTGSASALTVYGSVTGGQSKPPGSYADTVVATVTF
jgi:spore coat protein U-like protein